jgi:hypothetical protein
MMNGQLLPPPGFRCFTQKYENLLKNCVKVKNSFLLRLYIFQKSKIILSKGHAKALPVMVMDAVTLDAVYIDRAMLALS